MRLHPNDLAVQVTAVFLSTTPISEPLKDTLEECLGHTIRWPRAQVKGRSRAPTVDVTHVASVFQFSEPIVKIHVPLQGNRQSSVLRNMSEVADTIVTRHRLPL